MRAVNRWKNHDLLQKLPRATRLTNVSRRKGTSTREAEASSGADSAKSCTLHPHDEMVASKIRRSRRLGAPPT